MATAAAAAPSAEMLEIQQIAKVVDTSEEHVRSLQRHFCKDGTLADLRFFAHVCSRTGLDPYLRQVYAVFRKERGNDHKTMSIQVGIDGLRALAERTGKFRGTLPVEWCGPDGAWREVWLDKEPPAAARVRVLREGFAQPVDAVCTWASYAVWEKDYNSNGMKLGRFWAKMAPEQLAKCAEALALRRAFPQELSGLRTSEELEARESDVEATVVSRSPEPAEAPKTLASAPVQRVTPRAARERAKVPAQASAPQVEAPRAQEAPAPAAAPASEPVPASAPASEEDPEKRRVRFFARLGNDLAARLWDLDDGELVGQPLLTPALVAIRALCDDAAIKAAADATLSIGRRFDELSVGELIALVCALPEPTKAAPSAVAR